MWGVLDQHEITCRKKEKRRSRWKSAKEIVKCLLYWMCINLFRSRTTDIYSLTLTNPSWLRQIHYLTKRKRFLNLKINRTDLGLCRNLSKSGFLTGQQNPCQQQYHLSIHVSDTPSHSKSAASPVHWQLYYRLTSIRISTFQTGIFSWPIGSSKIGWLPRHAHRLFLDRQSSSASIVYLDACKKTASILFHFNP